jgi:hypothetical protein
METVKRGRSCKKYIIVIIPVKNELRKTLEVLGILPRGLRNRYLLELSWRGRIYIRVIDFPHIPKQLALSASFHATGRVQSEQAVQAADVKLRSFVDITRVQLT